MTMTDTEFPFWGNNLALDFINTDLRKGGLKVDRLPDTKALVRWLVSAGIRPEGTSEPESWPASMDAAWQLRGVIFGMVTEFVSGTPHDPDRVAILNHHLTHIRPHHIVQPGTLGLDISSGWYTERLDRALAPIALSAARLLDSKNSGRVRQCDNAECPVYFYDVSNGNKRRWCSMDLCGNRHKAATHYRRHQHANAKFDRR